MREQPILTTSRLLLRPFAISDAPRVQLLAGDKRIAETTANVPYPYPDGAAQSWIASHAGNRAKQQRFAYAITLKQSGLLVGCVSLVDINNGSCEMGYWIGVDYWNNGYCTEACRAAIDFAFGDLGLKQVSAKHFLRNPASGKVLEKSGLKFIKTGTELIEQTNVFEEYKLYQIQKG